MADTVEFFGERIRLADEPNEWAMLEFAQTAARTDASELAGLAAIMDVLEASIHEDDWQRFRALARTHRAQIERDLMPVVVQAFTRQTDRPTRQPSDSSDGLRVIRPSSTDVSSSPASPADRLVAKGRTDLAEFVWLAEEARSTG